MSTERKVGSDIDIAQAAKMEHINDIAAKLNIGVDARKKSRFGY